MHVIVIASQKGGTSKSTLALNLAVAATRAEVGPVVMIDVDPQQTLTRWWKEREAETPALASTVITELPAKIVGLKEAGFRYCFIDTPPAVTASIRAVIEQADLVLIPCNPSPADLWAVGATIDLCRDRQKPFAFILTRAVPRASYTVDGMAALSEHGQVFGVMHNRVAFARVAEGLAAAEVEPRGEATREISVLWTFVQDRFRDRTKGRKKERV